MRKRTYSSLGSARLFLTALIAIAGLASCSSTKHSASITSASRIGSIPQEASYPVLGAAAQSQSTSSAQASQSDGEEELLASTSTPATAMNSHTRLKEKVGQLNSQLAEAKSTQAVKGEVKTKKLSFPAKLLVNKLMKKTSRLSQKSTTQIGSQEATQDSNSSLLIVGLLIIIIGLLLTLLTVGTSQTIGVIALIVGLVVAILALVG